MSLKNHKSPISKPIEYDDSLITSFVRYGEADCIVRLFTRQAGRVAVFCKRGLSGKQGSLSIQAPALARVGIICGGHSKLARLVSCELNPQTVMQSSSLKIFGYCAYIAELIEKFLPEADEAPEIFEMVEDVLADLCRNGAKPCLLRAFELKLLDHCGYLPELPSSSVEERTIVAFDPVACRFISTATEGSWPFSYDALMLAKSMLIAKVGMVNYEGTDELMMIGRIFLSRLRLMGVEPLKSVAFLKQLSRH